MGGRRCSVCNAGTIHQYALCDNCGLEEAPDIPHVSFVIVAICIILGAAAALVAIAELLFWMVK